MRVLHIESGNTFNGGPRQVWELINGLAELAIENIVLCPNGSETAKYIAKHNRYAHNRVITVPMYGDVDVGMIRRIYEVIVDTQPTIVHIHSRRGADVFGLLAARKAKVPVVVSRRVDNVEFAPWARWKYHRYTHVITISNAIKQVLVKQGVNPTCMTCIHDAIDLASIPTLANRKGLLTTFNLPPNALVMVMVAQLIERKGHRYTLQAMAQLKHYPHLHLVCFGKGGHLATLQRLAAELGLIDRVHFVGFRQDLLDWLPGFDLLVHPADTEGMGVALLQASAAGLGIVASRAGGIPEVIINNETGLLTHIGDVAALAKGIDVLLSAPDLRQQLGQAARKRMLAHFTSAVMAERHVEVYKQMLTTAPAKDAH